MANNQLSDQFIPKEYLLSPAADSGGIKLIIKGVRVGRPSKRLALHQINLKVETASILSENKNKTVEYEVNRINHLPTFQEVRLHTKQPQYPGEYIVQLQFWGKSLAEIKHALKNETKSLRQYFPSIDETAARDALIKFG